LKKCLTDPVANSPRPREAEIKDDPGTIWLQGQHSGFNVPVVLAGDFNVSLTDTDVYKPKR
jgi:hypothetical protein